MRSGHGFPPPTAGYKGGMETPGDEVPPEVVLSAAGARQTLRGFHHRL